MARQEQAPISDKTKAIALQLAREFQESIQDPQKRGKAEECYEEISTISFEELNRPFTI